MKKNIIAIILLFTLTASALLPLTSCRINLLPNVQAPSDGGNGESTENGNGSSDEGGEEGGEEVPEEPELPVLPDLPASEGLEFETLTAEDGSKYLSVKGVGACEDRKIVIPHEHDGLPVKEISEKAFYTYRFYEEVIIPGTIEKIGDYAFCGSQMLEKVTLHTGIKTLGKNAFASCPKITEIKLPSTVTRVEDTAFSGCSKLETINFPRGMEYIGSSVVNGTAWYNDYTNWDGKLLYFGEYLLDSNREALDGVYTVKEGTRLIASHAFSSAERLYGVELPDTVEILCDLVFSYSKLVEIDLPNSIVKMGRGSFYCCYSLIRVKLSGGMNTVPDSTFMWCNNITEISIPDNVTTIGPCAFAHSGLTEITFPEKLTDLGGQAFQGCTNLKKLTFNANLEKIGISAFYNCYKLAEIELPAGITDIRGSIFEGTAFYDNEDNWEDGSLYIGEYLIATNVWSIASDYTVKEGTTVIADEAFRSSGVTSVTLPDSVKYICRGAFFRATELKTIRLTDSVVFIGAEAFESCYNLKDIYYCGTKEQWDKIEIEPLDNEYFANLATIHFEE